MGRGRRQKTLAPRQETRSCRPSELASSHALVYTIVARFHVRSKFSVLLGPFFPCMLHKERSETSCCSRPPTVSVSPTKKTRRTQFSDFAEGFWLRPTSLDVFGCDPRSALTASLSTRLVFALGVRLPAWVSSFVRCRIYWLFLPTGPRGTYL